VNPFPDTILSPTTANRIPRSPGAEDLIARLLEHDINAAAFLMDEDLLEAAEKEGFKNDLDRAVLDLVRQVPHAVFDAVFPPPPPTEQAAVASSDVLGGSAANDDGKREASMAPPRRRRSIEPRMRF